LHRRNIEFLNCGQLFALCQIVVAVEELDCLPLILDGVLMLVISLSQRNTIRMTEAAVDVGDFTKRFVGALDGKKIQDSSCYQNWAGIHQQEQSRMIEALRNHAVEVLLGIAVGIFEDAVEHPHG